MGTLYMLMGTLASQDRSPQGNPVEVEAGLKGVTGRVWEASLAVGPDSSCLCFLLLH